MLVPPDGFAALELGLRLADVGGELGFLLRQVRLELGKGRLAGLDLVGAQVDVGIQAGLALVDLALALVELADPVADRLLHRGKALLPPLLALGLRISEAFLARQRGLAGGELAFALLELRSPLLEIGAEARVALCMRQLGLEPVQLGLARSKLHLALVESGRARSRLADDSRLVGVLAFERFELTPQPLLLEQQLSLALAQGLVLGRDARALLLEVGLAGHELPLALGDFLVAGPALVLALRKRALAAFELDDAGALARLELVFGPGELLLAVGERLPLLLELARELRAVAVEAL